MPATVVVGAQWGDEGKGKIVDLLAQRSDVVCRYQGGPNAGHTIIVGDETFKIRQTPSGVISGKASVIGGGCVVDPEVLIAELDELDSARHRHVGRRAVRQRAPDHAVAHRDRPGVRAATRQAADRHDPPRDRPLLRRQGVADRDPRPGRARPEDPAPEDRGRARREERLARARLRGRGLRPRRGRDAVRGLRPAAAADRRRRLAARRPGAQATARTCSSRAPRRRCSTSTTAPIRSSPPRTRSPRAPRRASASARRGSTACSASTKAYVTRVGEGPFPSEIEGPDQERLRELGGEFGTVTGRDAPLRLARPRRAPLRRPRERHHVARADEARRPVGVRRAAGVRPLRACATARRPLTSRRTRATSTTRGPSGRRCRAGRRRSTTRASATSCRRRRGATSSSSSASSRCRSSWSASAPPASACSPDLSGVALVCRRRCAAEGQSSQRASVTAS